MPFLKDQAGSLGMKEKASGANHRPKLRFGQQSVNLQSLTQT